MQKPTTGIILLRALIVSLALHALLLLLLSHKGGDGEGGVVEEENNSESSTVNVTIVDKPQEKPAETVPPPPPKKETTIVIPKKEEVPPERQYVEHKCENYYGGIGVQLSLTQTLCLIIGVGAGYPADRAGIKVGDFMEKVHGECPGRGDKNTEVVITWWHKGEKVSKTMIREKICTNDVENP